MRLLHPAEDAAQLALLVRHRQEAVAQRGVNLALAARPAQARRLAARSGAVRGRHPHRQQPLKVGCRLQVPPLHPRYVGQLREGQMVGGIMPQHLLPRHRIQRVVSQTGRSHRGSLHPCRLVLRSRVRLSEGLGVRLGVGRGGGQQCWRERCVAHCCVEPRSQPSNATFPDNPGTEGP